MKEGSKYFHTYSNKVFGGWDMCIEDNAAGNLQAMRIVKEIEVCYKIVKRTSGNYIGKLGS